jgi:hypothetical protein
MYRSGSLVVLAAAASLVGLVGGGGGRAAAAPVVAAADDEVTPDETPGEEMPGEEAADQAPAEPAVRTPSPRRPSAAWVGHRGQFGVGLQVGAGLRGIKPYDDEYCGQRDSNGGGDAAACMGRSPVGIDLELTWGASARTELLIEARLGIERDFGATASADAGPRAVRLAPGARFYFAESGRTSFFSTLQAMFDLSGYEDAAGDSRGADLGVRNVNGLLIDLDRAYGLYVFIGETATFRRWLGFELEVGLGIQGRYP